MESLYPDAVEIADRLKEARLQVVQLSAEVAEAEYDLAVTKARVERDLIKKVGDEKRLGPTSESRERVFTLARDADEEYLAQLKRHSEAGIRMEQARVEVQSLRDRLDIVLTAMRSGEKESR
jgi:hypothetical protein